MGFVHPRTSPGEKRGSGSGSRLYPLLVLSTLTLYDASLVVLRLSGLLDFSRPEWVLLAALFFVSGPGSWALAATGVDVRRLAGGLALLGGVGVLYSTVLTASLGGSASELSIVVSRLAGLTLLMMGVMELLLVEDARKLLGGVTQRCLSGVPLYIWPLIVLFTYITASATIGGNYLPLAVYGAALAYSLASRPPEAASKRCTILSTLLLASTLSEAVAPGQVSALAAVMAAAVTVAPLVPAPKTGRRAGVIDRLVLLGLTAVAATPPATHGGDALLADAAVYAVVAVLGWSITLLVAATANRVELMARAAQSPVLRHAAGFALVIAGLHVLGERLDPSLAIIAAAAGVAVVNSTISGVSAGEERGGDSGGGVLS